MSQEPDTVQQPFRFRSRNASKMKMLPKSTTCSSSSSSSSSGSSSSSSSSGSSSDESTYHYEFKIGEFIEQYEVTQLLYDGTFGRVLEVQRDQQKYAIKIMNETDGTEVDVLRKIQAIDDKNQYGIVRFYDYFTYQDHPCIVFERLDINLHQYICKQTMTLPQIQSVLLQVCRALEFMHSLEIVHTDIKPENIVFQNKDNFKVKIIDMGGATQKNERHSQIINTRQYRAPEVILRQGWDISSDIWSLGCVAYELYTGQVLFDQCDDKEHYEQITQTLLNVPLTKYQPLYVDNIHLLHLIKDMLQIDPKRRITAQQLLSHSFFKLQF